MRELAGAEIDDLLETQVVGRIGCHAEGLTYVVPVIYAREDGDVYVASVEGQKIRMMRENPRVCFEVDEYHPGRSWRSVILHGVYEELDGPAARHALDVLAARFAGGGPARRQAQEGRTVCFRIRVHEASGRAYERAATG